MKTVQKSKKDVLEFWRNLGFLYDLKEGGIIEWRCAKSFELMANFMMADENLGDKILETWSVAAFPILRHCLVKGLFGDIIVFFSVVRQYDGKHCQSRDRGDAADRFDQTGAAFLFRFSLERRIDHGAVYAAYRLDKLFIILHTL